MSAPGTAGPQTGRTVPPGPLQLKLRIALHAGVTTSNLANPVARMQFPYIQKAATFTARVIRDGEWFIAFSPEFPEGNGQGSTEEEALESLRESILLLLED